MTNQALANKLVEIADDLTLRERGYDPTKTNIDIQASVTLRGLAEDLEKQDSILEEITTAFDNWNNLGFGRRDHDTTDLLISLAKSLEKFDGKKRI